MILRLEEEILRASICTRQRPTTSDTLALVLASENYLTICGVERLFHTLVFNPHGSFICFLQSMRSDSWQHLKRRLHSSKCLRLDCRAEKALQYLAPVPWLLWREAECPAITQAHHKECVKDVNRPESFRAGASDDPTINQGQNR